MALACLNSEIGQAATRVLELPPSNRTLSWLRLALPPLAFVDAHRHRLLHRNVQAARERPLGRRRMHRMRQDLHHVEIVLQELHVLAVGGGLRKRDCPEIGGIAPVAIRQAEHATGWRDVRCGGYCG